MMIWLYPAAFCPPNCHTGRAAICIQHTLHLPPARCSSPESPRAEQQPANNPPPYQNLPLNAQHTQGHTHSSNTNCVSAQRREQLLPNRSSHTPHSLFPLLIHPVCCTSLELCDQRFSTCEALQSLSPSIDLPSDCDYHLSNLPLAWAWWGLH